MSIITQPHLGYYTVGNDKFKNPVVAFLQASKTKEQVQWVFNDLEYSQNNWTLEPTESLDTLYGLRAKELREKYDHITICYSGGSDSNNALMSFLNNNLKVDEILTVHNQQGGKNVKNISTNDKSASNAVIAEYELQTIPRLREIHNLYPDIKITNIDVTSNIVNRFINFTDSSWIESGTGWVSPAAGSRWDISKIPEIRKTLETGKRICYIGGFEKPRCAFKDDEWYMFFNDKSTHSGPDHSYLYEFPNSNYEFFYWGNTYYSLRLLTKQAFVVKRFVESRPELYPYFQSPLNADKVLKVHEPLLRQLLYSTWHESIYFQGDKPVNDWNMEYDDWFWQHKELSRAQDIWQDGIEHIIKNAKDFILYENDKLVGFKKFYKRYYVGKFNGTPSRI
jgi:hypothetical protein